MNMQTVGPEVQHTPQVDGKPKSVAVLDAALALAKKDLRVIPLHGIVAGGQCTCGEVDCRSAGKHPRIGDWEKEASTDEAKIKAWFARWSNSNLGVATGPESRIFVIDEDRPHSLSKLMSIYGDLPKTLTARTGRGRHFYYRYPAFKVKTKTGLHKMAGIDVRGERGEVVAPPSVHHSGRRYEWEDPEAEIAVAPDWLLNLLREDSLTGTAPDEKTRQIIPGGKLFDDTRKRAIFEISAALHEKGNDLASIRRLMLNFDRRKCSPPLEQGEVLRLIESAVSFINRTGTQEDSFVRRRSLLPWSQHRPEESLTKPRNLTDYQRGWLEYLQDYAWLDGGMLFDDTEGLFEMARGTNRAKFQKEIGRVLAEFHREEFEGHQWLVHPEMAEEWAEAAVKWSNKSIASRFNRARKKHSSGNGIAEEAA